MKQDGATHNGYVSVVCALVEASNKNKGLDLLGEGDMQRAEVGSMLMHRVILLTFMRNRYSSGFPSALRKYWMEMRRQRTCWM